MSKVKLYGCSQRLVAFSKEGNFVPKYKDFIEFSEVSKYGRKKIALFTFFSF